MKTKTDVEIKKATEFEKIPHFREIFFKLSNCGLFGAIVSGKDVLRWIASREAGIIYLREAAVYQSVISHSDKDSAMQQILVAPSIAMREEQVEFHVRESVQKLNSKLEAYQGMRRYMFTLAEKVDTTISQQLQAPAPFDD